MQFNQRRKEYTQIQNGDEECIGSSKDSPEAGLFLRIFAAILCLAAFTSSTVLATIFLRKPTRFEDSYVLTTCEKPDTRQEWRSLTLDQQHEYINAVQCLTTQQSRMGLNHSLHDDYAYSHIWHGHVYHDSASFLLYHRWFLHLYQTALREQCQYNGNMIYWDWSLDWENPYHAPVFDTHSGFGGQGTQTTRGIRGYCVDEGPFANYSVPFFDTTPQPHCLSREFYTDEEELAYWARMWSPEYLESILSETDHSKFLARIEEGPHLALPKMLHGDFSAQSAPIDPLFMLHHTNLDRLYWLWQQRDPLHRFTEYRGPKTAEDSLNRASLEDLIVFGTLGPSVRVRETLRTESEKLCYRYPI